MPISIGPLPPPTTTTTTTHNPCARSLHLMHAGVDPKSMVCEFFRHGQCTKGAKCKFSHDLNVERKVGVCMVTALDTVQEVSTLLCLVCSVVAASLASVVHAVMQ